MNNSMPTQKSLLVLALSFLLSAAFSFYFQFSSKTLIEGDSYYHMAVTQFMKEKGFSSQFHWTQMSTMKTFYADKDLLMHLLAVPFLAVFHNPQTGAKAAAFAMGACFMLIMLASSYRLARSAIAAALLLPLLMLSSTFDVYMLCFRPATLANIFTVIAIIAAMGRHKKTAFAAAFLYSWAHISSFTLLYFAAVVEICRYLYTGSFCKKTFLYTAAGVVAGIIINPYFPQNLWTIYINGFLAPIYAATNKGIDFAIELYSDRTRTVFLNNIPSFAIMLFIFWTALVRRVKISYETAVLLISSQTYIMLSIFSNRFWYPAAPLTALAAAAYWKDLSTNLEEAPVLKKRLAISTAAVCLVLILSMIPPTWMKLKNNLAGKLRFDKPYVEAALWMRDNLPPGETIYHSTWGDSPYFIALNPKDDYLTVLDPIYMYMWSPAIQQLYQRLGQGYERDVYGALKNTFHTKYAFTLKGIGFYNNIKDDPRIKPLYQTNEFLIFEVQ